MNNKTRQILVTLLASMSLAAVSSVPAADAVQSIRGADVSANDLQPGKFKAEDGPPIERNYVQQPPLIRNNFV